MAAETWEITPWKQPTNQAVRLARACGGALVTWPSGRRTLEQFAGCALVSELEYRVARDPERLLEMKVENLHATMRHWQEQTYQRGYWMREKRRVKARRVLAVEWLKLSAYHGPPLGRGGVLQEGDA